MDRSKIGMTDALKRKVLLEQTVLNGESHRLQRVATVYRRQRISSSGPREAKGNALDWVADFSVWRSADGKEAFEICDSIGTLALVLVKEELLERVNRHGDQPDEVHSRAGNIRVCQRGHAHFYKSLPVNRKSHCAQCGAPCIDECSSCKEPIQVTESLGRTILNRRSLYCNGCGKPYPWRDDRLTTIRELLYNDCQLTESDREELWPLLQFVMSDPTAELAAAKTELVAVKPANATSGVREVILSLVAKTAAETVSR